MMSRKSRKRAEQAALISAYIGALNRESAGKYVLPWRPNDDYIREAVQRGSKNVVENEQRRQPISLVSRFNPSLQEPSAKSENMPDLNWDMAREMHEAGLKLSMPDDVRDLVDGLTVRIGDTTALGSGFLMSIRREIRSHYDEENKGDDVNDKQRQVHHQARQVLIAIKDEGSHPPYHREVMARHRREWPTLWKAIDGLCSTLEKGDDALKGE